MRLWLTIVTFGYAVLAGVPRPAAADEVSVTVSDRIEEKLSGSFLSPQTTIWHFDSDMPYVSGERLVCGWVNFQSAQQVYVGYHQFYAIMLKDQVTLLQLADPAADVSGQLAAKLKALCGAYKSPG